MISLDSEKYVGLVMQLGGIIVLILGLVRKDTAMLAAGFLAVVLNLATSIYENNRKIDKVEMQLSYEERLSLLERKVEAKE